MKIPKSITAKIQKKEERERKERLHEIKEEKKEKQKTNKHNEKEVTLYLEKLELSKRIFQWTKEGKKIIKDAIGDLSLYHGGWGHCSPSQIHPGCWAAFILENNGTISYRAGYKWMGFRAYYDLKKPEEIAKKLNFDYLEKIWHHLNTGKVFKDFEEEIDDDA